MFYDQFQPLVDAAYDKMEKYRMKTGETCPNCGGDLIIKNGPFGKFAACINYPTCKYTKSLKEKPTEVGRLCPKCGSQLMKKKGKTGSYFIGCANWPTCDYSEQIPGQKTFYRKKAK